MLKPESRGGTEYSFTFAGRVLDIDLGVRPVGQPTLSPLPSARLGNQNVKFESVCCTIANFSSSCDLCYRDLSASLTSVGIFCLILGDDFVHLRLMMPLEYAACSTHKMV